MHARVQTPEFSDFVIAHHRRGPRALEGAARGPLRVPEGDPGLGGAPALLLSVEAMARRAAARPCAHHHHHQGQRCMPAAAMARRAAA
eukprot:scaffold45232_cov36-Tisochrysis_lutea.AAC.1